MATANEAVTFQPGGKTMSAPTGPTTADAINIEQLPPAEKLTLIERLWQSLASQSSELAPPTWHESILAERSAALQEGRDSFVDWDDAKQRLRERFT